MGVNSFLLKKVKAGDPLSASEHNEIIRLLNRRVTGPNVIETSTGWHIRPDPPSPAAATSFEIAISEWAQVRDTDANTTYDYQAASSEILLNSSGDEYRMVYRLDDAPYGDFGGLIEHDIMSLGKQSGVVDPNGIWYVGDTGGDKTVIIQLQLRAITEDFDCATITWNILNGLAQMQVARIFIKVDQSDDPTDIRVNSDWHLIMAGTAASLLDQVTYGYVARFQISGANAHTNYVARVNLNFGDGDNAWVAYRLV